MKIYSECTLKDGKLKCFFRESKSKLAIDKYQIRSVNGIKRFWLISSLAYLIACYESNRFDFSEGYHILMKKVEFDQLKNLYFIARKCDDFEEFMESAS